MGHEFQSPLRRWDVVAGLCQSIDARTYVEVGCREGRTVGFVLEQCPEIRAIAIDPWCEQAPSTDVTRETYSDWNFEKIQEEFWKNVGDSKDRCEHLRTTGTEVAERWDFKTRELPDVVFIDALHDYASVAEDIREWWPMVRDGGYLVLHDYNHKWPGVMRAVAESFNLMDVGLAPDSVAFVRKPALAVAA
jgi:hypothetical protein